LGRYEKGNKSPVSQKEIEAYGWLATVDSLANGDLLKWAEVLNMPYEKVRTKLMLNADVAIVQERLQNYYKRENELKIKK